MRAERKYYIFVLLLVFISSLDKLYAQSHDEIDYRPSVGVGTGILRFYGDVHDNRNKSILSGRPAYELNLYGRLNKFLNVGFYVLRGKLSENEMGNDRNLNFESQITTGGVILEYDFNNLLKPGRLISPYIAVGIESFEFNSKSDVGDRKGNTYYYWSDGSIRNIDENASNASSATKINRDYYYETDLREEDLDGFGKYQQRSWAFPVGFGAIIHVSDRVNFKIGSRLHVSLTDYIDNVASESDPNRLGAVSATRGNDKFLMTSFSFAYKVKPRDIKPVKGESMEELLALYPPDDQDKDGVIDFFDDCMNTPAGVKVDERGCPGPLSDEFVDSLYQLMYLAYFDTLGIADQVLRNFKSYGAFQKEHFKVNVGSFDKEMDEELVAKLMSIPGIEAQADGETTTFTVGDYDNLPDAIQERILLSKEGIEGADVVEEMPDGHFEHVNSLKQTKAIEATSLEEDQALLNNGIIYRVQIGAFSPDNEASKHFSHINDVIGLPAGHLIRYMTKEYRSFEDAVIRKTDLYAEGYHDAFVVAYKDGERVSLSSTGVKTADPTDRLIDENNQLEMDKITFRIQIGLFAKELPTSKLTEFLSLKDVQQQMVDNGLTRYTAGIFKTIQEAEVYRKELSGKGYNDAFIIAMYDGNRQISINKAKSTLGIK